MTEHLIDCPHCSGKGKIECDCPDHALKRVEGHPLNQTDYEGSYGGQGYVVKQCVKCKRIWGIRYQWDPGTGSDNHTKDFGFGDPFELVKERHY